LRYTGQIKPLRQHQTPRCLPVASTRTLHTTTARHVGLPRPSGSLTVRRASVRCSHAAKTSTTSQDDTIAASAAASFAGPALPARHCPPPANPYSLPQPFLILRGWWKKWREDDGCISYNAFGPPHLTDGIAYLPANLSWVVRS
jgi:hypothetical protein